MAAAAFGYVAFVATERTVGTPLMNAETLARRPMISGTFVMLLATGLMLALFFLSSLYLQHLLGFGALRTGLTFLPVAVAITLGAQVGAHLLGTAAGHGRMH